MKCCKENKITTPIHLVINCVSHSDKRAELDLKVDKKYLLDLVKLCGQKSITIHLLKNHC